MRTTTEAFASFLILLGASMCPSPVRAQLTDRLDRCLPYGSYAREVAAMHAEATAHAGTGSVSPRIVIVDVVFEDPIRLTSAERETLVRQLKALPIRGEGDWLAEIQDVELSDFWKVRGYFNAQLTARAVTVATDGDQQQVVLHIHADEGRQYRLGTIAFRSADPDQPLAFPVVELEKQLRLREGDVLDVSKVRDTLDALKLLFASHGYIDFVATPITEIDEQTQRVSLTMELDQQKQFRIGKIEVFTNSAAVRRSVEAAVKSGDVFNVAVVQRILKEDASLLPPDVSQSDIILQRDVKTATVDVRLELEPCPQLPN
jgi:hypothetical protein